MDRKRFCLTKKCVCGLLSTGLMAVAGAYGAVVEIADEGATNVVRVAAGDVVSPAPARQVGYPDDVGTPAFWLDASDAVSWTRTADGDVTFVPSKTASAVALSRFDVLTKKLAPKFVAGETEISAGGGVALDFGETGSSRSLYFVKSDNPSLRGKLENIGTIATVYNSRAGGGWVLGGGGNGYNFHRAVVANPPDPIDPDAVGKLFHTPLFFGSSAASFRNGRVLEDGRWIAPQRVGYSGTWQPLVFVGTTANVDADGLGCGDLRGEPNRCGGMMVAEMLIFDRVLTDAEALRVHAYLAQKWFGRTTDGVTARELSLLKDVSLNSGTNGSGVAYTVDVPAGDTFVVQELTGGRRNGSLLKTGAGTLRLGNAAPYTGRLTLSGGTVEVAARPSAELPTRGLFVHLDASCADSLETTADAHGTAYVDAWHDVSKAGWRGTDDIYAAAPAATNRPWLVRDGLNGRAYVDFGKATQRVDADAFEGRYMNFNVAFDGVATAFWVVGAQCGGGNLLGLRPFIRPGNSGFGWDWTKSIFEADTVDRLGTKTSASLFVDGRRRTVGAAFPAADWFTVGYAVPGINAAYKDQSGVQTITLCGRVFDYVSYGYKGGQRLAEMLLYNRVLTDEETAAVHRYLREKWFTGDMDLFTTQTPPDLQDVAVAEGTSTTLRHAAAVELGTLAGSGTLVDAGTGSLRIGDAATFSGTLVCAVSNGPVTVAARTPPSALTPAAAPILRIDASVAGSYELAPNADGTNYLVSVRDLSGHKNVFTPGAVKPFLNDDTDARLNGHPVFDFGLAGSTRWLTFRESVDTIRAAYVVIGSQAGGGFLLGSSVGNNYDFHRHDATTGDNPETGVQNMSNPAQLLFHTGNGHVVCNRVNPGELFIDGEKLENTGLSGGYQLVEVHTAFAAHASAFACDRGAYLWRSGGQRLAEVVLYDRVLSEPERVATRNYLLKKWFNKEPQALPTPAATVASCRLDVDAAGIEGEGMWPVLTVTGGTVDPAVARNSTFRNLDARLRGGFRTEGSSLFLRTTRGATVLIFR